MVFLLLHEVCILGSVTIKENLLSRLVCGVGINDADYPVRVTEELGMVNGKKKEKDTMAVSLLL
tara:strand:- start:1360 stop:1551 length:192 start_codon:yes stop_codon:yes gene_type:complete